MCFSAAASFTTAAVIGAIGVGALAQRPEKKRLPFAAIPLIFAAHQAIEGAIWLSIGDGAPPQALVLAYLFIAQIFWPIYTPLAVLVMESDRRRRLSLWILLAAGAAVSAAMAFIMLRHNYSVEIVNHSLHYATQAEFEKQLIGLYVVATTAPLLLSPHRYVIAFGATVLLAAIVTELAFYYAGASVWCFFAAIASGFVFLHIRRRKRLENA